MMVKLATSALRACVWTCLQPGVVEGLIDSDSLSRVQHQHASHQVLGTLRDVGPLARVHLDKDTRAHAHRHTRAHTGEQPHRKNISNQDHLLWICITLSISLSIMSVKVKSSRSVGRAQYLFFFQRNVWDFRSLMGLHCSGGPAMTASATD